jgi:peroxiredoxin
MAHLQEGEHVPEVVFKTREHDQAVAATVCESSGHRWKDVSSKEIFDGKKIVVFGLPGAFTPTCSTTHAPGYEMAYDEFKKMGIDEIYCLSVNDAFVMNSWAEKLGLEKVKMLPDGNTTFTKAMGMLVKKEDLGFGDRSWRYSMFVDDGTIKKMFVEAGLSDNCPTDPFEVSDAATMLMYLKSA